MCMDGVLQMESYIYIETMNLIIIVQMFIDFCYSTAFWIIWKLIVDVGLSSFHLIRFYFGCRQYFIVRHSTAQRRSLEIQNLIFHDNFTYQCVVIVLCEHLKWA